MKNRKPKAKQGITPSESRILSCLHCNYSMSPSGLSVTVDPMSYLTKVVPGMHGTHSAASIEADIYRARSAGQKSAWAEKRKRTNKMLDDRHSVSAGVHRTLKKLFEKKWIVRERHENEDDGSICYSIRLTQQGRKALTSGVKRNFDVVVDRMNQDDINNIYREFDCLLCESGGQKVVSFYQSYIAPEDVVDFLRTFGMNPVLRLR